MLARVSRRLLHGFGHLKSRRFIKLDGIDAGKFLQGLTTNDIQKLHSTGTGQYSALLNAQVQSNGYLFLYYFCF